MPVFSGYFLAMIMLVVALIGKLVANSPDDVPLRRRFQSQLSGVSTAIVIFAATSALSCLALYILGRDNGSDLTRGYLHFFAKNFVLWFAYLSFYWRFAKNDGNRLNLARSFAFFSLINLTYCLLQREFGFDWARGFSAALPANRLSNGVYRVSGFMSHPLSLGYCQALACVSAFGMASACPHRWEKIAWRVGALSALIVVLISGSRGPQVVLLIGLMALYPTSYLLRRWKLSLVATLLISVLAVKFGIFKRFYELSTTNFGGDMRITHWAVYWQIFKANILFGIGPAGQEAAISAYYSSMGASDKIKLAHNAFLQHGADYGVLGLLGLAVLFGAWIRLALRMLRVDRVLWSMIVVTVLGALTQNNLQDSEYVLAFTIWLMLIVTIEVETGESSEARRAKAQDRLAREGCSVA